MIQAIETVYKGYRFRSRLEARWAVFFDALKLEWEYEPEGFELGKGIRYLPDFKVKYPGRSPRLNEIHYQWFEVKPDIHSITKSEWIKMLMFHKKCYELIILDGVPRPTMYGTPKNWHKEFVESKDGDRAGVALWSHKGRCWGDDASNYFGDNFSEYSEVQLIYAACAEARSARF